MDGEFVAIVSKNGDAFTQYNTEPFYNPKKPRIEPNKVLIYVD